MEFGSTTYVMLIGQFCKWLKMWPKIMFRLTASSGQQGKMASRRSLYLGNLLPNKLFQKSTSESTTKLDPRTAKFGSSTSLFCWPRETTPINVLITFFWSIEEGPIETLQLGEELPITKLEKMTPVVTIRLSIRPWVTWIIDTSPTIRPNTNNTNINSPIKSFIISTKRDIFLYQTHNVRQKKPKELGRN